MSFPSSYDDASYGYGPGPGRPVNLRWVAALILAAIAVASYYFETQVNPVTGEPVFKTLNYSAQLLRPGEETELKRETAGTYYVVIEGTGATEVGGKRFDWSHNDLFVVPNFLWRRHINTGKTDAVIYSVSDAALMRNIGQYYAQGRSKDGKVTELVH